jgi:hypothetical protein
VEAVVAEAVVAEAEAEAVVRAKAAVAAKGTAQ